MTREELLRLIDQAADEGWTELDLAGLGLEELPREIGKCTQLETLVLGKFDREKGEWVGNQLTDFPDAVLQLTNLKILSLACNQITEIPEAIASLSNLTKLYLGDNQIAEIPEAIASLSNLTKLYLGDNQIAEIPEAIASLSNLTVLDLYNNQIAEIPEAISQLSNLTTLDLSGNQLAQIPDAIAFLSNMTVLYLWDNQLAQIPEASAQLSNLTRLDLSDNQITEIPEAIERLTNLTKLDIENNKIEKIPEFLETLPKLEKLDLRRNPLPISPEVLVPANQREDPGTPAAIFNYLRQLRSGEVRPLNEAKVLLVGQSSVGKTSLINRLINNKYNPNERQTDGLNITDWHIRVNTKEVKLNVWDFGGQEIYHATHQFFLTKRSVYILVCNCRTSEEENHLEYWLKLIESFGDASPVLIVGNKWDEQPLDLNRKALRDKYPNIKAILETSCETGTGIEELRAAIHTEIAQLKEVYLSLDLRQLLDGYEPLEVRRRRQMGDLYYGREYEDIVDIAKLAVSRPIITKAEAQIMTQDSSQTNNFQGANFSGIIAGQFKDNSQVSNNSFIQNNNANTAELLQII